MHALMSEKFYTCRWVSLNTNTQINAWRSTLRNYITVLCLVKASKFD